MSKQLTYKEIVECYKRGRLLDWHEDYDFFSWKDGKAPLKIKHISSFNNKYFVGYYCSNKNCDYCSSDSPASELGGHFQIISKNGMSEYKKLEFQQTKKGEIIRELNNPVFKLFEE